MAIILAFFGLWLRTGTLAHFRVAGFRDNANLWPTFRHALRHMVALAVWAFVFGAVEWCLYRTRIYAPQFGVWLWQKLPGFLRIATPRQLMQAADWVLWFLFWVVVPAVWLPAATTVAADGFSRRRMGRAFSVVNRPLYWLWFCIIMLIGAYVPYKLMWWIPDVSNLRGQAWSMGLRCFVAYVIVVTAWLALVWLAGSEAESEDAEQIAEGSPDSVTPGGLAGPVRS